MLVCREVGQWLLGTPRPGLTDPPHQRLKGVVVGLLFLWQLGSVLQAYPAFLAYFNEAVGGAKGGVA